MGGGRQRAEVVVRLARESGAPWKYFVGLEGGLDVVHEGAWPEEMLRHSGLKQNGHRRVFLESWAYVTDVAQGYYGRSGGIEVPEPLAHEVLENGIELSLAIDKFAGAVGIRDPQRALCVLAPRFITRHEAS